MWCSNSRKEEKKELLAEPIFQANRGVVGPHSSDQQRNLLFNIAGVAPPGFHGNSIFFFLTRISFYADRQRQEAGGGRECPEPRAGK